MGGFNGSQAALAGAGALQALAATDAACLNPALAGAPAAEEVVSQIIQGIDQAAVIGEHALKEAGTAFGELLLQLHEVSRDRELWVHRFFAARELQYSGDLCERAAQMARAEIPVAVSS